MLRLQVTPILSKIVNIDSQLVKQPVRTYRTRINQGARKFDVRPKDDEIKVTPPPGVARYVFNRNPRNLERLSIANKGDGWFMDNKGKSFWHKLVL